MTRYNDVAHDKPYVGMAAGEEFIPIEQLEGYREGVDRVIQYVDSIQVYPKLTGELKWAIEQGII